MIELEVANAVALLEGHVDTVDIRHCETSIKIEAISTNSSAAVLGGVPQRCCAKDAAESQGAPRNDGLRFIL